MSVFDSETGLRLRPDSGSGSAAGPAAVAHRTRNPFHVALTIVWALCAVTVLVGLFGLRPMPSDGGIALELIGAVGVIAGIAQLAAAAASWRPPGS